MDGAAGAGGSAGPVDVDGRAGFEAVFLDPVGQEVRQRWEDACVAVAFEDLAPVSGFPVVPGRRWGSGLWWSATTGRHVVAGSSAMRAQLTVLDRDPQVVGLAGRPVRLVWRDRRGGVRSWVPQLFARYADGTALLADCPGYAEAGGERALRAAAAVRAACDLVGWRYRRLEPLDAVLAANLRWLAGYRHPRYQGRPGVAVALLEAFARPRPLLEGVEAVGSPIAVLPAVFHALWHGWLSVSLERPLHEQVVVGPGNGPGGDANAGRRSTGDGDAGEHGAVDGCGRRGGGRQELPGGRFADSPVVAGADPHARGAGGIGGGAW